jgi:hypothetical protein
MLMRYGSIFLLVSLCLCSFASESWGQQRKLPPRYYAAQTLDFFGKVSVATVDGDGLARLSAASQDRNGVLSDAYEKVSKAWMLAEKGPVDKKKDKNRRKARRFKLNKPSYTSVHADGPYGSMAEAEARMAVAEAVIAKKAEREVTRKASKLRMMSARVKKSYEAKEALIEEQMELFLTEVSALQHRAKVSRMAEGSREVKRIENGVITKLVENPNEMMIPDAGSGTATRADPRGVKNR